MKVSELILKLQAMNQDVEVLTRGYEDGYDPINSDPVFKTVYPMKDKQWYNGTYDEVTDWDAYIGGYLENTYDRSNPLNVVII